MEDLTYICRLTRMGSSFFVLITIMSKNKYSAIEYAMKYLQHNPKSERDVSLMLLKKGYPEREIAIAKKRLQEMGLLDDALFVELYINSEVIKKWKAIFKVKWMLYQKWISKHLIDDYCNAHRDAIREGMFVRIKEEIKKYKRQGIDGIEIIQKLQRKGYNLGYIKEVIKRRDTEE